MRTLAEIIEEWKRLRREFASTGRTATGDDPSIEHFRAGLALDKFYAEHGPRLLAVAEAAVEARIVIKSIIDAHNARLTDGGKLIYSPPTMGTGFIGAIEWLAAFDAAASGEGRG